MIHLDTHAVIWLSNRDAASFSQTAATAIRHTAALGVSPMVRLELQILHERGRLDGLTPGVILERFEDEHGPTWSQATFSSVITRALDLNWTRDPFDRLIVANALADDVRLITADRNIRENFSGAIW